MAIAGPTAPKKDGEEAPVLTLMAPKKDGEE